MNGAYRKTQQQKSPLEEKMTQRTPDKVPCRKVATTPHAAGKFVAYRK